MDIIVKWIIACVVVLILSCDVGCAAAPPTIADQEKANQDVKNSAEKAMEIMLSRYEAMLRMKVRTELCSP